MKYLQPEYTGLIGHLNEDNFKMLVREFLKEYYDTKDVQIKDGPYDGGNDIVIYRQGSHLKRNNQVTVQKTGLEKKLSADLEKAKYNVSQHGYDRVLDFFCTVSISGKQVNDFKKDARINYGIELNIFDASTLASLADSYSSIKISLLDIYDISAQEQLINVNKHTKVLYDMFAIGKDASELKRQFLHSLIITFVFDNPNCNISDITNGLKGALNENGHLDELIRSQVDRLRIKGVLVSGEDKGLVDLAKEQKDKVQELLDAANSQEGLLKNELNECLSKYKLEAYIKEIIDFVYKSFQINYEADLEELSGNSSHNSSALRKIFAELREFISVKAIGENDPTTIAKEVLDVCTSNTYLNKVSASILFTKLFQSNKLESYISQRKTVVFFDTQILLRLICQDIDSTRPDSFIEGVFEMTESIDKYNGQIIKQTSTDYVLELTKHIIDALKLDRLFKIPIVQKLGGQTSNVIYNYYKTLTSFNRYDKELDIYDFVSDILDLDVRTISSPDLGNQISSRVSRIFEFFDIQVVSIPFYEEFNSIKKEYEIALFGKIKSAKAIDNDVKTICYLSSNEVYLDLDSGLRNEPVLITWDKTFFSARKNVADKYSNRGYWYIYTPSKYADRLSVQSFQLNPKAINNNLVSLTESNFNTVSKVTFLDMMSSLFSAEDLTKIDIAHRLIELERITRAKNEDPVIEEVSDESPLISILTELRTHYSAKTNHFGMEGLVMALENNQITEKLFSLITGTVDLWKSTRKIDGKFYESFDELIKVSIQAEDSK